MMNFSIHPDALGTKRTGNLNLLLVNKQNIFQCQENRLRHYSASLSRDLRCFLLTSR